MIAGMTYYQIAGYFIIYSFLGWCIEVVYHALKLGKVINRGFLNGPVCPVYGFGVVGVFALTKSVLPSLGTASAGTVSDHPWRDLILLFLIGMLLTTAIELVAGWLLDVCFHARWWDYSKVPLNFRGYICLPFSIIWGIAVVFVVRIVQPAMESESSIHIPERYGWPILAVLYVLLLADLIVTVMIVAGMNRRLKELDKIQKDMRIVSDSLSGKLGNDTMEVQQKLEEHRVHKALAQAELKEHAEQRLAKLREQKAQLEAQLTGHRFFGSGRLLRAFPNVHHRDFDELLQSLKK